MFNILDIAKNTLPRRVKEILRPIVYRQHDKPFEPYLKKKNIEGVAFDFWIGDKEGREWYDLQCADPTWIEMRFIKEHLIEQGDVVFECGGHHGCAAIVLSHWVGIGGKVVTFEPLPSNIDIFEKNIRLNRLANVSLEKKAVGASAGTITINEESNSSVSSSTVGIQVELACLDEYEHLKPTFLKIDVEGFEMQVLQGAKKILSTRPKLAIEIHTEQLAKYGASVGELFKLLNINENYEIWIQWEDGQQPKVYDLRTPIKKRVHLFGIPLVNGFV